MTPQMLEGLHDKDLNNYHEYLRRILLAATK